MKKKALSIILVIMSVFMVFSGLTMTSFAEESPNLLEMYGYNPNFDDGIPPWVPGGTATAELCDEDSADDDGYCLKLIGRNVNYSVPQISGGNALQIFTQQGAGTYYYSFYVKCVKPSATAMISPTFQLVYGGNWSDEGSQRGDVAGLWPSDPNRTGFEVNGREWTKIEMTVDVELIYKEKSLAQVIIYGMERQFDASDAPDLMFDNYTLIKKSGGWVNITPEPAVTIPSQKRVDEVTRSEKTAVGAINYFMWFETLDDWWNHNNAYAQSKDRNSVQEARSLSPAKYHFHLPFFATLNTSVTQSNYINGDLSAGVAEFPEYTKEIWTKEMEYAIDAGIDYMAYTWAAFNRTYNKKAFTYHIETKGLDGRIKMCAIIQESTQDLNAMANAAVEDYWYTIDGMPVVYIFGGEKAITEDLITLIRKKIAIAQFVKNGEVGKPAYIVGMGVENYSTAVGVTSRGIDAVSWYAHGGPEAASASQIKVWDENNVKIRTLAYGRLTKAALEMMGKVGKVAQDGYASVIPLATLGYELMPRLENNVSWVKFGEKTYTFELPTAKEVTQHVLDVLNYNKENAKYYRANSVLIYAWNEFNEGGWFCPTLKVDENGNAIKDANGNYQANTEYLDAVKKAIALYRQHEAESAIYDVNGEKIKDVDMSTATHAPAKTAKPSATVAPIEQADEPVDEGNSNGWVLWTIIGGAVVLAAAAAVVVIVALKKKKAAAESQE